MTHQFLLGNPVQENERGRTQTSTGSGLFTTKLKGSLIMMNDNVEQIGRPVQIVDNNVHTRFHINYKGLVEPKALVGPEYDHCEIIVWMLLGGHR